MPDISFTSANQLLDDSARLPPGEATRFLFDHYRCAKPDMQDAIVLALIGSVLTSRVMLEAGAIKHSIRSVVQEVSS